MPRALPSSQIRRSDASPPDACKTPRTFPADASAPPKRTILLVDDDPSVLDGLGRVLATEGWRVIAAASGEEALRFLADRQPDLMITDLRMADISGWDLLFHEKMQRPDLPIFVITALPPTAVGGADRFATDFFQKPLDIEVMLAAIRHRFRDSRATSPP